MGKITPFGRLLRKLRIDHGEMMRDMAHNMGVSAAYLSIVELGKKTVPCGWCERLAVLYPEVTLAEFQELADLSRVERVLEIPAESPDLLRHLVKRFSESFLELNEQEINNILEILNRDESK